ncbi:glycosyltransferase family 4 protein [Methylomonas rhizoryzae]|uniref:glycosyltransferase family 4 protein n=1 Tax=Methylomonas rhizoryzae TaxID=2608981 RepID=UPI001232277D|nr:glycosyltransferase family 4 protein [Methylomonas rhizoryzae]
MRLIEIVIFQPVLKKYRVPLFIRLGDALEKKGYKLTVVCGSPPRYQIEKNDNVLSNGKYWVVGKSYWLCNERVHFLPIALKYIVSSNIFITEQANKHFHNIILLVLRFLRLKRFAYWGHGQNRQGNPGSISERIKRLLICSCDWWFAYTKGVAELVVFHGFPSDKITVLNNSIDTTDFRHDLDCVSILDVYKFKIAHRIPENARIGLFCGSLYSDKKLDFLLSAAIKIHKRDPLFYLLIIGGGDDKSLVESFADQHSFIIYVGSSFGIDKAIAFKSAEVFLCPGLVGLAILDAFVAGLPLITTNFPYHSPEIEYLKHDFNGLMSVFDIDSYADMVVDIFADRRRLSDLRTNATNTSIDYSIEKMASNFEYGILGFVDYK